MEDPKSLRSYARSRGISHVAVLKAIQSGRLVKSVTRDAAGKPKISDAALADREWVENTDQSKPLNIISGEPERATKNPAADKPKRPDVVKVSERPLTQKPAAGISQARPSAGRVGQQQPEQAAANEPAPADPARGPSFAQSQAIQKAYQARMAKLEYEEKAGKLLPADAVRVSVFNTARKCRDMLMALPDRVAPLVAGNADAHEIHRILTDEVRRVCAEIVASTQTPPAQS